MKSPPPDYIIPTLGKVRLKANTSHIFKAVENTLGLFAALYVATSYMRYGNAPLNAGDYASIESAIFPVDVRIPLFGPLQAALYEHRIDVIDVTVVQHESKPHQIETSGFRESLLNIVAPNFVTLFEAYDRSLKMCFGDRRRDWPDLFKFCSFIRNASSHGGIANNPHPCSWRGYRVTRETHSGRPIIGTEFAVADFYLLMLDFDAELQRLIDSGQLRV